MTKTSTNKKTSQSATPLSNSIVIMLTKEEAAAALTISTTTFAAEVKTGRYPPAREVSPGRVGWLLEDLLNAARQLPQSNGLPPKNSGYGRKGRTAQP